MRKMDLINQGQFKQNEWRRENPITSALYELVSGGAPGANFGGRAVSVPQVVQRSREIAGEWDALAREMRAIQAGVYPTGTGAQGNLNVMPGIPTKADLAVLRDAANRLGLLSRRGGVQVQSSPAADDE